MVCPGIFSVQHWAYKHACFKLYVIKWVGYHTLICQRHFILIHQYQDIYIRLLSLIATGIGAIQYQRSIW